MGIEPRVLHIEILEGVGGIETFLLNVYRNIDRSKLQFDFVSSKADVAIEEQINDLGGKVFKIKYGNGFSYYHQLVNLIKSKGYKVVHIHKNSAANIIPFLACKRAGVKTVIAHAHSISPSRGKITKVLHYLNRPILNTISNEKFACSGLAALWMFGKRYFDGSKVVYIKNGIEIEHFTYNSEIRAQIREKLGLNEHTFVIGNVGRMERVKNQVFLVDILAEVKKKYADTKLLICGDGKLKGEIVQRAKKFQVEDCIIMLGVCKNVNEMLQAMDVYVMPSLYEGLSVSAVEAQCAALPTFISDTMSSETKIIKQCQILPLNISADDWALKVLECRNAKRVNTEVEMKNSGYDIIDTAFFLQKFYLSKFK
ncbi:MAG: glycosyltransferase [Ruminococcus flavefaciens]|nr:glycosyltransferase [Ruminococcus flavefaciens]